MKGLLALALLLTSTAAVAQPPRAHPPRPFAFAPYIYTTDGADLAGWAKATGHRHLTLAFYNSDGGACRGAWPVEEAKLLESVRQLRILDGDVILSLGGWNADDLAARCPDGESLADVYEGVLRRFSADHLDLDPEPGDVHDNLKPEVVDRRSAALAVLQRRFAARGQALKLSFTIAVRPAFGFDAANLYVLRSAVAHGVEIDIVNPMIMDYRDGTGPGEMGARSIQALEHAHEQLKTLLPGRTDEQLWAMMSATPMIGQNDAEAEVFTLADARLLADFARRRGMGRLSFWSAARDNGDCPGERAAKPQCSGVAQTQWEYTRILGGYAR